MATRIQGEGDYESARRYNSRARKFVEQSGEKATRPASGGVDSGALRKAKSKARAGGQDARDARVMRNKVSRGSSASR